MFWLFWLDWVDLLLNVWVPKIGGECKIVVFVCFFVFFFKKKGVPTESRKEIFWIFEPSWQTICISCLYNLKMLIFVLFFKNYISWKTFAEKYFHLIRLIDSSIYQSPEFFSLQSGWIVWFYFFVRCFSIMVDTCWRNFGH